MDLYYFIINSTHRFIEKEIQRVKQYCYEDKIHAIIINSYYFIINSTHKFIEKEKSNEL